MRNRACLSVVSYRNSTSNHNSSLYFMKTEKVVSYRNSTSNHNCTGCHSTPESLYLIEILHQTTTYPQEQERSVLLYLIEILHQTTTCIRCESILLSCILSKFYIKPQRNRRYFDKKNVVSYRNSTSNHNTLTGSICQPQLYLIEILHQTTTVGASGPSGGSLYLIEILHQTTTPLLPS